MMLVFLTLRTHKLIGREEPFFSLTTISNDDSVLSLQDLGHRFAIQEVPANVGTLTVNHVHWTKDEGKVLTPI